MSQSISKSTIEYVNDIYLSYKMKIPFMNMYFREIKDILSDTKNFNKKTEQKHFPAIGLRQFSDQKKNTSFSLSSKSFEDQLKNICYTAERRLNALQIFGDEDELYEMILFNKCVFGECNILYYVNTLKKYESQESIRKEYPYFMDRQNPDRILYNLVYTIETENPHMFVKIDSNNTTYPCNKILLCRGESNGKFNIFFETDLKNHIILKMIENDARNVIFEHMYYDKTI